MLLHESKTDFSELITRVSEEDGINEAIIEKDYYVTMFLRELCKIDSRVIFKGGTSLSKCYGLIERFSEDVDLNCGNGNLKPTVRMRRDLKNAILTSAKIVGLKLENADPETIPYKRDYYQYFFSYESCFESNFLKKNVQIETSFRTPSVPADVCTVRSYTGDFLKRHGYDQIIEKYSLGPFRIQAQSIRRTFADKLYAVADYYLTGMSDRDSRHLYDLYKLTPEISIDEEYAGFLKKIRIIRKDQPNNPSAQSDKFLWEMLQNVINSDFYKSDYEKYTVGLLFENVSYKSTIQNLQEIVEKLERFDV